MSHQRSKPLQSMKLTALNASLKTIPYLGQSIPGATYFFSKAPPFFPPLGIALSLIGVLFLLVGYQPRGNRKDSRAKIGTFVVISILLLALYGVVLQYCTVLPPGNREGARQQIGFYMWPLTEEAQNKISDLASKTPPIEVSTPNDLMQIYGVWGGISGTERIWPFWAIFLAGSLLLVIFVAAFALWTHALGMLARLVRSSDLTLGSD